MLSKPGTVFFLDVARYVFKKKTTNLVNIQTKSVRALMTDLGLCVDK